MRAIRSRGWPWGLVACVVGLGACSDDKVVAQNFADTSVQPAATSTAKPPSTKAPAKVQEGLRFTIDGPALGGPTRFGVPGDQPHLNAYLSDSMFSVTFRPKEGLMSEDGKHRLDFVVLGLEPAAAGESTDADNVREFSMGFTADTGTLQSQSVSMSFKYSKGTRQPVRLTLERYDTDSNKGGATGHFTGRMQRTNIKSNDQFYEAKGEFAVR